MMVMLLSRIVVFHSSLVRSCLALVTTIHGTTRQRQRQRAATHLCHDGTNSSNNSNNNKAATTSTVCHSYGAADSSRTIKIKTIHVPSILSWWTASIHSTTSTTPKDDTARPQQQQQQQQQQPQHQKENTTTTQAQQAESPKKNRFGYISNDSHCFLSANSHGYLHRTTIPTTAKTMARADVGHNPANRIPSASRYTPLLHTTRRATTTRLFSSAKNGDNRDNHPVTSSLLPTVQQVLHSAVQELQAAHVDEAEDSVFQIVSKVLDLSWKLGFRDLGQIYHSPPSNIHDGEDTLATRRLTQSEQCLLNELLTRRKAHEPIQYLMGQWDFLDHVFLVVPPLLCPRPETEELVLYAEASFQQHQQHQPTTIGDGGGRDSVLKILDVGAGTGCIGISLASRLPQSIVTAIDVEPQAIQTARANAQRILGGSGGGDNNDDGSRYQVHLVGAQDFKTDHHRFDLVVSNPPYIPSRDMETLDAVVSQWESHQALCGGEDGMDVIRTIVQQLPYWCRAGADCWMEVDPTHPALLQSWLGQQQQQQDDDDWGVIFVESRPDLFGLDRTGSPRRLVDAEFGTGNGRQCPRVGTQRIWARCGPSHYFCPIVPRPEHLQRIQLVNLFVDTPACDVHTTGCDCLKAGVLMVSLLQSSSSCASMPPGEVATDIMASPV
eukprot:scaffold657_cov214-Amphora_coffeaeformis.AAC.9